MTSEAVPASFSGLGITPGILEVIHALKFKTPTPVQYKAIPIAIEGKQSGHWILVDYGDTIIHIFLNSIRDYYAIDTLWKKAVVVDVHV